MVWPFRRRDDLSGLAITQRDGGSTHMPLRPPPVVRSSLSSTSHEEAPSQDGVQAEPDFKVFSQVPKFLRVLTHGADHKFKLEAGTEKVLVAIELAGRKAQLISSNDQPVPASSVASLIGALSAARFEVLPTKTAPSAVIADIYTAGSTPGTSAAHRNGNAYMALVHQWISYAVDSRATDIHIAARGSQGEVKVRVDGELEPLAIDGNGIYPAANVIGGMAALFNNEQQSKSGSDSLFDQDRNLYCMVPYNHIPGHNLRLRYQSLRGNEGPKVVLRLLPVNEDARTLSFAELGYAPSHIRLWNAAMQTPSGAVLISGVTGSGKSTTQKTFIENHPSRDSLAILTLEDPVEYPIKGAHQVPIQRDLSNVEASQRSYGEVLAAILRHDPDIVMVGEVRDRPSAIAMQEVPETGHMALGTVHAHLLSGIIPRLVNPEIGMHREILTAPNMLTLLVYQALVPVLCPNCSSHTADAVKDADVREFVEDLSPLAVELSRFRWKRAGGCVECGHRGTVGLTVVAEMLMPDDDWLKPIREGRDSDAVNVYRSSSDRALDSENMSGKTVFEHTLYKALQGRVDPRQCARFDNVKRFVNRYRRQRLG